MAVAEENSGMDRSTCTPANSILTNDETDYFCQQLSQLWCSGGLNASNAMVLFNTAPALKHLLQPIVSSGDAKSDVKAYCLTAPLLSVYNELSQLGEWQLVLLGLNPKARQHWLSLAAARCREAGAMSNPQVLVKLIQQLGNASEWVFAALETPDAKPHIVAGALAQTERELLGHSLNDNAAIPALCRILRTCFHLHALSANSEPLAPIQAVDTSGKQLASNWCNGRLMALPEALLREQQRKLNEEWLLVSRPAADAVNNDTSLLVHFVQQPWLFLLSLISFVQDAWAAELRGGLLLTLPAGQNAFAPSQLNVVVQGIDGDEVHIGSLAEFVTQLLTELNIALYPALASAADHLQGLNRALSPVVAELLAKKIWQFFEAGRGESGQYRIHPEFSDACYSLPLAPLFGYKSQHVQQAIKQLAQTSYTNQKCVSVTNRINVEGLS